MIIIIIIIINNNNNNNNNNDNLLVLCKIVCSHQLEPSIGKLAICSYMY